MKVLIDISEEAYKIIVSHAKDYRLDTIEDYIVKGKPIYDNPTNGDVIKALFPKTKTRDNNENFMTYTLDGIVGNTVERHWWDALYGESKS